MSQKLIIFDLDGTLVNSLGDLTTAVNLTLRELGKDPLERDFIARHIGSGTRKLLEPYPGAMELFQKHYLDHVADETRPYPGIMELLESLRDFEKIILTNKMNIFLQPLLKSLRLENTFSAAYGLESFPTSKPHPGPLIEIGKIHGKKMSEMYLIGDTEFDVRAGKAAGVRTCAVTWGYGQEDVLRSQNPELIIHHPQELIAALHNTGL